MREADRDRSETELGSTVGGSADEAQLRLTRRMGYDLDLRQGQSANAGAERFGGGFLGSEASGKAIKAAAAVRQFALGENAVYERAAASLHYALELRELNAINASTNVDAGGRQ